jgi:hypothetical protein
MKNSLLIAMEYNSLLPPHMVPAATSGYEGFYHLNGMEGDVEMTKMHYLVRNHDWEAFQKQKSFLLEARDFLNRKHGEGTVEVEITDTYYNMKEKIKDRMEAHLQGLALPEPRNRRLERPWKVRMRHRRSPGKMHRSSGEHCKTGVKKKLASASLLCCTVFIPGSSAPAS